MKLEALRGLIGPKSVFLGFFWQAKKNKNKKKDYCVIFFFRNFLFFILLATTPTKVIKDKTARDAIEEISFQLH